MGDAAVHALNFVIRSIMYSSSFNVGMYTIFRIAPYICDPTKYLVIITEFISIYLCGVFLTVFSTNCTEFALLPTHETS